MWKTISEMDTLYPYQAYLETLLTGNADVLNTRMGAECWNKDAAGAKIEALAVAGGAGNAFRCT
jgi:hypothetical protein